jgi:hypothetical protein
MQPVLGFSLPQFVPLGKHLPKYLYLVILGGDNTVADSRYPAPTLSSWVAFHTSYIIHSKPTARVFVIERLCKAMCRLRAQHWLNDREAEKQNHQELQKL